MRALTCASVIEATVRPGAPTQAVAHLESERPALNRNHAYCFTLTTGSSVDFQGFLPLTDKERVAVARFARAMNLSGLFWKVTVVRS